MENWEGKFSERQRYEIKDATLSGSGDVSMLHYNIAMAAHYANNPAMKLLLWLTPILLCVSCASVTRFASESDQEDFLYREHDSYLQEGDPYKDTRWTPVLAIPPDKREAR